MHRQAGAVRLALVFFGVRIARFVDFALTAINCVGSTFTVENSILASSMKTMRLIPAWPFCNFRRFYLYSNRAQTTNTTIQTANTSRATRHQ